MKKYASSFHPTIFNVLRVWYFYLPFTRALPIITQLLELSILEPTEPKKRPFGRFITLYSMYPREPLIPHHEEAIQCPVRLYSITRLHLTIALSQYTAQMYLRNSYESKDLQTLG